MRASTSTTDFGYFLRPDAQIHGALDRDGPVAEASVFASRTDPDRSAQADIAFGPFRLLTRQFLLLDGNKPVSLGSRALEILILLLERPGELVSKHELMARVWPNIFVEPANLTVHMSALRRVLRDGQGGNRFIINIPGRGYKFVGAVAATRPQKAPLTVVSRNAEDVIASLRIQASPEYGRQPMFSGLEAKY